MSSQGSVPRLGPAWHRSGSGGGGGFQPPPPATTSTTRMRSGSYGSAGSDSTPPTKVGNKFSILDDDDDGFQTVPERKSAMRSASFTSTRKGSTGGRSLADLAARVPNPTEGAGGGRFRRSDSTSSAATTERFSQARLLLAEEGKITRYTREKLLALRPRPSAKDSDIPEKLKHLEGTPILSTESLDPVCWDNFDADEIWAQVKERPVRSASMMVPPAVKAVPGESRRSSAAPGFGKWQRGVALPPPDETRRSTNKHHEIHSDNPNDLWDDPLESDGPAADFSAFGALLDDPKGASSGGSVFDFDKMTQATAKFEEELRRDNDQGEENGNEDRGLKKVDSSRPLSGSGLTIRSGSGDDVNVFEDFDDPGNEVVPEATTDPDEPTAVEPFAVKSATHDADASSRLMQMIGVQKDEKENEPSHNPWATTTSTATESEDPVQSHSQEETEQPSTESVVGVTGLNIGNVTSISSNPWGAPAPTTTSSTLQTGFDLQQRLQQVADEQKRQAQEAAERERRRQAEEEERLRILAQKQAEEQARVQAMQQQRQQQQQQRRQQQGGGHSQVELILMERISQILENSWGRSDLMSILTTLHTEDSRVIPLLGNTDSLRALISRHPLRVAIRHDPALGAEMAILLQTNSQWQQQRQLEETRAREEELRRLEQERRMSALEQQKQQAQQKLSAQEETPSVDPSAPWFYSDPQGNVQGPFRNEEMRQWLEAGYFKGDLPISQQRGGPFRPLGMFFPEMGKAFRFGESESDAAEAAAAAAAAEEERITREKEEEKRRLADEQRRISEEQRRMAEERARIEAEEQRATRRRAQAEEEAKKLEQKKAQQLANHQRNSQKANDSSAQLKMMLGVSAGGNGVNEHTEPDLVDETPNVQSKKPQKAKSQVKYQPEVVALQPAPPPKPAAVAWGGAAKAHSTGTRKSMSEIQQEEARASALLAMERKAQGRTNNSGWANVAAKGAGANSGWQSGAMKPGAASVIGHNPTFRTAPPARTVPNSNMSAAAVAQRQAAVNAAAKQQATRNQKPADEFGAKMSPQLESWCKARLVKLTGSDDLTLVSFCMTLKDAEEIRQYITTYLGATPQVNEFAAQFISRRGDIVGKNDEWESTVKPKKGKKKK